MGLKAGEGQTRLQLRTVTGIGTQRTSDKATRLSGVWGAGWSRWPGDSSPVLVWSTQGPRQGTGVWGREHFRP